jgi:5-formyltetrahydrofolate cyclo-ligase
MMKTRLAAMSPADAEKESQAVLERLFASDAWKKASLVLTFMSMPGELNTDAVIPAALTAGKTLYAPRVEADIMNFYKIDKVNYPWQISKYGIREPIPNSTTQLPVPSPFSLLPSPLILTPGLAFARSNNGAIRRLGRGKGYYDKFFASLDEAGIPCTAAALAFSCQLVDEVPAEPHDRTVDLLFTP